MIVRKVGRFDYKTLTICRRPDFHSTWTLLLKCAAMSIDIGVTTRVKELNTQSCMQQKKRCTVRLAYIDHVYSSNANPPVRKSVNLWQMYFNQSINQSIKNY